MPEEFKTAGIGQEPTPCPSIADRAAAVCCYLVPNPLKGALARNRGEFVQHHFRQAVGLSCMAVALVLLLALGEITQIRYALLIGSDAF
jgi:hypothetical protein